MRARWRGLRRTVPVAVLAAVLLAALVPVAARVATPGPSEPCVPGTVWEDRSSGVKYICVYDELYGGSRWELLSSSQTGASLFTYRSSAYGCVFDTVALSLLGGGGGNTFVRSFRWPCAGAGDRASQPPGELRIRTVLQRFGTSWANCRDTGYAYNAAYAWSLVGGYDMGAAPDCGAGTYRTWGIGQLYQGGAWRGSGLATPSLFID
jgi:hypothetical protein